jgi:hypothetical protein
MIHRKLMNNPFFLTFENYQLLLKQHVQAMKKIFILDHHPEKMAGKCFEFLKPPTRHN